MDDPQPPLPQGPTPPHLARVRQAMVVGLTATAIGALVGTAMAVRAREVPCPDGTYFPEGTTDFTCSAHPLALQGSAVLVMCVALAAVLVACGAFASQLAITTAGASDRPVSPAASGSRPATPPDGSPAPR